MRQRPWLGPSGGDQVFRFASSSDFVRYFQKARSLGALFSYIGSIVVRRDKWMAVTDAEKIDGCHYAHAFRLFSLLRENERKLLANGYSHGQLYFVKALARSSLILAIAIWLGQTLRRTDAAAFKLTRRPLQSTSLG